MRLLFYLLSKFRVKILATFTTVKKKKTRKMMKDIAFKIIVVGDQGAGKTSLVQRFAKNQFTENYKATVKKFSNKISQLNNRKLKKTQKQ